MKRAIGKCWSVMEKSETEWEIETCSGRWLELKSFKAIMDNMNKNDLNGELFKFFMIKGNTNRHKRYRAINEPDYRMNDHEWNKKHHYEEIDIRNINLRTPRI